MQNVKIETPEPSQPGMAERAIDTATDVSRTLTEVSEALQAAAGRLSDAIAAARRPGMPLATISAITREAPLASLFVAFLCGIAIARRHERPVQNLPFAESFAADMTPPVICRICSPALVNWLRRNSDWIRIAS